ncbi:MAG: DNA gyrase subunit A, partial [Bacteroidota bacterium]|nr:DNA gyrase subunit A [Bacteroidota bacterium]
SRTPEIAREGLIEKFNLSEIQAKAILDLRLHRLTGLERDKIKQEYDEIQKHINYLKEVLSDENLRMQIIKDELIEIKDKYGDERRTEIVYSGDELRMEDIIADEEVVVTISHMGYIKRTSVRDYRRQGRGGRGSKGAASREEDYIEHIFTATTHGYMLFFTELGKCFWLRVYEIPEGIRTTKGRAIQNLIQLEKDDKIRATIALQNLKDEDYLNNNFILFCTKKGIIKKTPVESYSRPRQRGIIAINVAEGDQLLDAILVNAECEVVMATRYGQAIRFDQRRVRSMGRNSTGVIGVRLGEEPDDEVVGMICIRDREHTIMVVSEKGYGKRSPIDDYRITNRGAKGIRTLNITEKTGKLIAILDVAEHNDLMIITKSGILIRTGVSGIRSMGRATQGVRLIRIDEGDEIASITKVEEVEDVNGEELDSGELEGTATTIVEE